MLALALAALAAHPPEGEGFNPLSVGQVTQ